MRTQIFNSLKVVTLAVVLSFGLSFVYAWTAPTQSPPAGNVSAPINTSATEQIKAGGLGVLGHMGIGANPDVNSQLNVDGASNSSSRILLSNTNTGANAAAKYQIEVSGGSLGVGKMGSNFGSGGAGILAGEAFISNSSGNFKYMVLGSIKAVIDANGKVGIGGASLPSQTLTVAGDVGATGDICTSVTGSAVCLSTAGGLPSGGTVGQVLTKNADGTASWQPSQGGMTFLTTDVQKIAYYSGHGVNLVPGVMHACKYGWALGNGASDCEWGWTYDGGNQKIEARSDGYLYLIHVPSTWSGTCGSWTACTTGYTDIKFYNYLTNRDITINTTYLNNTPPLRTGANGIFSATDYSGQYQDKSTLVTLGNDAVSISGIAGHAWSY